MVWSLKQSNKRTKRLESNYTDDNKSVDYIHKALHMSTADTSIHEQLQNLLEEISSVNDEVFRVEKQYELLQLIKKKVRHRFTLICRRSDL